MTRLLGHAMLALAISTLLPGGGWAQESPAPEVARLPVASASPDAKDSLQPLSDPATGEQIREYLRLSGDIDSFRTRWIAAVDKNRSIGAPYWPEAFWTAVKDKMRKTDLTPMFITLYQHGISRDLMQEVLAAYHRLGADHFQGSPECFKLGDAELGLAADMDKLKLAKTLEVVNKVYAVYKPEIKAARVKYMAEHPGWSDK